MLHIFGLCAFAIVQPLLTAMEIQSVYLVDQRIGWSEISMTLTLLLLVPSIGCLFGDFLARRFLGKYGRNAIFFLLFGLALLSVVRKFLSIDWLLKSGFAFLLLFGCVLPISLLLAFLYDRLSWLRAWLTLASLGIVIFPAAFLWQFQSIIQKESLAQPIKVGNAIPVVIVVFDEFSGTTLMNDQMEIDAVHFPNFARLANCSTWYRNFTTVHPRTDIAVPAILSGRFPIEEHPPLGVHYPGNLLQVIDATKAFDQAVFEPVTRLCPISVNFDTQAQMSTAAKTVNLLRTLATVYPRLILTGDLPLELPRLPLEWLGIHVGNKVRGQNLFKLTEGLFHHSGNQNRRLQLDQFLNTVKTSTKPRFVFLHAVFPHCPWIFFPSGEQYQMESSAPTGKPEGGFGELGEDWTEDASIVLRNEQRYRLQVGYADRFIGQLIDRLQTSALMDDCLLIVAADHGVSFRPNHSRRIPDADNMPDILSVPLFIKFPGQTGSRVDDRNVESVDILPTVAEVLKIILPEPIDGLSVTQDERRPRKSFYFNKTMTVIEPNLPQRESSVRRQFAIYGDRDLGKLPDGVRTHPDWQGRSIDSFEIEERTVPAILNEPLLQNPAFDFLEGATLVPSLVWGNFRLNDLTETPADLVVAVDGVIQDSGKTFPQLSRTQGFEFVLPLELMKQQPKQVQIYQVIKSGTEPRLRRVETSKP